MVKVIPAPPYAPNIQGYTWGVFLVVFIFLIMQGSDRAWAKVYAYIANQTKTADGITQVDPRMVWIVTIYIYAYAYVRVMFLALATSLILIMVRLVLSIIPLKTHVMRVTMDALNSITDARNLLEFLHFRHWKPHCTALGIYLALSFAQCYIVFAPSTSKKLRDFEEVSRQYTRVTMLSLCGITFYYLSYAAMTMVRSGTNCAPSQV